MQPVILAQDPSFRKMAFSLYDGKRTIYLDTCSFSLGESVGFERVFEGSLQIFKDYKDVLYSLGVNDNLFIDYIISEIPPPNSMYSAGLFALDTHLLYKLYEMNSECKKIYTLPPSFLVTLHNRQKYKKSDSTKMAKYFMEEVFGDIFEYKYSGRLNADQAESFLFLVKGFYILNVMGFREVISSAISGFFSPVEKILIERE